MSPPPPHEIGEAIESRVAERTRTHVPKDGPVVAGVSGGVDSIVLLHALAASGREVVAAHVNYGLRGADSDADERLVREVCEKLGASCRVMRAPKSPSASVQAWARSVRYAWFEQVAAQVSAPAVAVAHHVDDQAETVLINIIRGTGIDGLRGMRPVRPLRRDSDVLLIRPLLGMRRADIESYARIHGVSWREDASNTSERYLRSRVRSWTGGASGLADAERIAAIADRVQTTRERLSGILHGLGCPDPSSAANGPLHLPERVLSAVPPVAAGWIVNRILSNIEGSVPQNRDVVDEVLGLIDSQVGRRIEAGDATVWRMRDGLRFESSRHRAAADASPRTFQIGDSVDLPGGRLETAGWGSPPPDALRLPA
ncbi:MAG: tRNA lysidine(34) synthetase TilS, partial [Rhodothermales bacterium]|nr:tRNA lysidine(34) synthetase TilS [Rhodothermales bacterium]